MEPTREQLAQLARQIAATAPQELDCEAVLDRVAAFLEATAGSDSVSPELESVGQHLRVCPSCYEEFQALVQAVASEEQDHA